MANIAKELRNLRARTGLSMDNYAKKLGYRGASGYQRFEMDETFAEGRPLSNLLAKKLMKIVGIGKPPIKKSEIAKLISLDEKLSSAEPSEDADFLNTGTVPIREIDLRAGLGGGGLTEAVNTLTGSGQVVSEDRVKGVWQLPAYYLSEMGLSGAGLYLFRAIGDSMTRMDGGGIHSGDVLLADTKDRHPSPPGIFALHDGFGVVVKRLEFLAYSDPPRLSVRSDNPAHANVELMAEEVRVIGRCVWYGRGL